MDRAEEFEINKRFSDDFIKQCKAVVGPYLLDLASFEQDCKRATDLVVRNGGVNIAMRVRRQKYRDLYPWDVTIRSRVPGGHRTEWDKMIVGGMADWFFYGHTAPNVDGFPRWFLLHLDAVRRAIVNGDVTPAEKHNADGTGFRAIDLRTLGPDCIIGSSEPVPFYDSQRKLFAA